MKDLIHVRYVPDSLEYLKENIIADLVAFQFVEHVHLKRVMFLASKIPKSEYVNSASAKRKKELDNKVKKDYLFQLIHQFHKLRKEKDETINQIS